MLRSARLGVTTAILLLATSATAQATFPGEDGPLSYNRFDDATGGASIFRAEKRGNNERQLTHFAPGTVAQFSDWSPDGRLVAFDSNQTGGEALTYVMRADGSHIRQLTDVGFSADPAWAPNGKRIAIEADWGDYPASEGIWIFRFRKSGLVGRDDAVRVTTTAPDAQFDSEPQYSPDGRWIAFTRFRSAEETAIFLVRPDGTRLHQLTDFAENGSAPDWSPNGKWITYDTHDASNAPNAGNIVLIRPDGSDRHVVIAGNDTDYNQNPVFSPSGTFIAWTLFPTDPNGEPFIWTAHVDGSHRRKLHIAGGTNKADWGPKPTHQEDGRHKR